MIGLVAFVWLELVYGPERLSAAGLNPHDVAVATLVYSAYTFARRWRCSGVERWLERGETFSVYFGMFASLSPLEVRDGRLGAPPGAARRDPLGRRSAGSIASSWSRSAATTFDGAAGGRAQGADQLDRRSSSPTISALGPIAALRLTNTLFLGLALALVAGLFWAGISGMRTVRHLARDPPSSASCSRHAFIPIALAYLVAHYFSLVVFQEQAQFGFLLSDPLGNGSDIFGTAGAGIDYGSLSANATWYVQVAALVDRPRDRARPRPRPGAQGLRRHSRDRRAIAVLDAGADGRLHLARPLPALAGERLSPG